MKLEQDIKDLDTKKELIEAREPVDMPVILTYVKYFVIHLKELLIDHCNPILKAKYFGVIFDGFQAMMKSHVVLTIFQNSRGQ